MEGYGSQTHVYIPFNILKENYFLKLKILQAKKTAMQSCDTEILRDFFLKIL
jgi:hypothetical protein